MSPCWLMALAAMFPPPAGQLAHDAGRADAVVDDARALLRRGLLGETEQALAAMPAAATSDQQGHAQILLGNVAFERGQFDQALACYVRATALFEEGASAGARGLDAALRTARENQDLARGRLDRRALLSGAISGLRAALIACVCAAGLAVALLARRAGENPPTG